MSGSSAPGSGGTAMNRCANPSPRMRRYLGIQIFTTVILLGAGGMLISEAVTSRLDGPPVSLVAGAALTAGGLIFLWNLVRPH